MRRLAWAVLTILLVAGSAAATDMDLNKAAPGDWAIAVYSMGGAGGRVLLDREGNGIMSIIGKGGLSRVAGRPWVQATVGWAMGWPCGGNEGLPLWMRAPFWQDGFDANGLKSTGKKASQSRFTTDPQTGDIYFGDASASGKLTVLHPNGETEVIAGASASYGTKVAPDGRVWFQNTARGGALSCYDPETGLVTVVDGTAVRNGDLAISSSGTIFFRDNAAGQELACYDPATGNVTHVDGTLSVNLVADAAGRAWFQDSAADDSLGCYNPATGTVIHVSGTCVYYPPVMAPDGQVWFQDDASDGNLACYNPATGSLTHIPDTAVNDGALAVASDGTVWFQDNTGEGNLTCCDPETGTVTHVAGTGALYPVADASGKIWFQDTSHGGNLACYDPATAGITYVDGSLPLNIIAIDAAGNVWFPNMNQGGAIGVYAPSKAGGL